MSDDTVQFVKDWEPSKPPDGDKFIWRYINFTQIISIFENNSIWFSRLDQFQDPYEGTLPEKVEEAFQEHYTPSDEENPLREIHAILLGMGSFKYLTYANCWHINDHESAAMWELYRSVGKETAIRTTVSRLEDAVQDNDQNITFGEVRYVDYDEIEVFPILKGYAPAFHKRSSFCHENEYRAVFIDTSQAVTGDLLDAVTSLPTEADPGKAISVDVSELIESIWVSPTAPGWIEDLLNQIINTYQLDIPIRPSNIDREPETVTKQAFE